MGQSFPGLVRNIVLSLANLQVYMCIKYVCMYIHYA